MKMCHTAHHNRRKKMTINVVPADKGKFKILVNFIKEGIDYSTATLANQEAKKLLDKYPNAVVHYASDD
jgi:hypothetical protein